MAFWLLPHFFFCARHETVLWWRAAKFGQSQGCLIWVNIPPASGFADVILLRRKQRMFVGGQQPCRGVGTRGNTAGWTPPGCLPGGYLTEEAREYRRELGLFCWHWCSEGRKPLTFSSPKEGKDRGQRKEEKAGCFLYYLANTSSPTPPMLFSPLTPLSLIWQRV